MLIADYLLHKYKSKITLIKCKAPFFFPEQRSHSSIGRNYLGSLTWQIFLPIWERPILRPYDPIINIIDMTDELQAILEKLLRLAFFM